MRHDGPMANAAHPSRIVIVGASLAGASAAIKLRELGYAGELTLIGEEAELPYERPPLSKAVLIGNADEPDWVGDEALYADQQIELVRGTTVTRIDRAHRRVVAGRHDYGYDRLLLATGSTPRQLDVRGADLDGLFTLRTFSDSLALRERFTARGAGRGRRRGLDRVRGGLRGPAARLHGDHDRAPAGAAVRRGRGKGGRDVRCPAPRARGRPSAGHQGARLQRRRRRQGHHRPAAQREVGGGRHGRGRRRGDSQHLLGRGRRVGPRRQRDRRRRDLTDLRPGHLRGR